VFLILRKEGRMDIGRQSYFKDHFPPNLSVKKDNGWVMFATNKLCLSVLPANTELTVQDPRKFYVCYWALEEQLPGSPRCRQNPVP
jgi:hypothetical protein